MQPYLFACFLKFVSFGFKNVQFIIIIIVLSMLIFHQLSCCKLLIHSISRIHRSWTLQVIDKQIDCNDY